MKLSVIIVNFQVKYFLECCLRSTEKALQGLDAEIIVVDNDSRDDSLAWLQPRFPAVRFLANRENTGFAKANNQALAVARGEHILFLNPDTVLPEDIARHCLGFLASTPGIGALGVRMIDGSGRFLKESRRGFPTPWVAFCRLSGLAAILPRSRFFSAYYLGHLPPDKPHPAPVLSGACLWVSRAILQEVGCFDERFFLYAEDIDLSFRIGQAGYTNFYTPQATIIHFKGESTRRDIRYIRQFYLAMRQFRRKHFNRGFPAIANWALEAAIGARASAAAILAFFRPKPHPHSGNTTRCFVTGDDREAAQLKQTLSDSGKRSIARNEAEAEEWIFCEGEGFSFGDTIRELEARGRNAGNRRILIHGKGCGAAIGSPDRKQQGETLVLQGQLAVK